MPRPERDLFPDLDPPHAFPDRLRRIRKHARDPTYATIARHTKKSRTALSDAAGGDGLPAWDTVVAYVSFCGVDPNDLRVEWERVRDLRDSGALLARVSNSGEVSNLPRRPVGYFAGRDDA